MLTHQAQFMFDQWMRYEIYRHERPPWL